ncbi:MAG: patatin-like phospholipase family protein [Candidatus Pacebacteria bacterium]|nr:patatin-like phospholipase family protein [Candidatus Paceibacterota bacterium]
MKIGLVLSGGGTRAAVFHLGVLKRLAEAQKLKEVSRISSVSGGSLITALIFSRSGNKWPSSSEYLDVVYPQLKSLLTSSSLFSGKVLFKNPSQLIHIGERARIVANLLRARWGVDGHLTDLPDNPLWEINTTCIETGRNWYFSKAHMGDWIYGESTNPSFTIAEAVAASAAVPYALGALKLELPKSGWNKSNYKSSKQLEPKDRPASVRLWDGGVYENLGLERVSKPGKDLKGCDFVVISDASAPLQIEYSKSLLSRFWNAFLGVFSGKLKSSRLLDITSEQIRSLRVRTFFADYHRAEPNTLGVHVRIGNSVRDVDAETNYLRPGSDYTGFLTDDEVRQAALHSTSLKKLDLDDFERVSRHGYEALVANLEGYAPDF